MLRQQNSKFFLQKHRPTYTMHRQSGALLLVAMVMLLILSLLGFGTVSTTNIDLQIAGNQQRQNEAELVAENTVNYLVENYPLLTLPSNAIVENYGQTVSTGNPSNACVTKTIIEGSGTPGSLACSWQGGSGPGERASNSVTDHEKFKNGASGKSCMVGNYIEEEHPHLHHLDDDGFSPIELWINGDVTITKCGGCFKNTQATINYTGQILAGNSGTCSHGSETYPGSWPSNIMRNKVTQAEFNAAAGASPSLDSDYYSQVEIRVTSTDPASGATATAVKGFKYRGDSDGSPTNSQCGVTDGNIVTVDEDPWLTSNGSRRVLYSYLEID